MSRFTIRPARPDEGPTILEVMRPWNMHHVPSAEMEALDLNCFFVAEMDGVIIGPQQPGTVRNSIRPPSRTGPSISLLGPTMSV